MDHSSNPTPTPTAKEPKSLGLTLIGDGGATMRINGSRRKDGSFQTFVVVYDGTKNKEGKKTSTRGASSSHKDIVAAKAEIERLMAAAQKVGWNPRRTGGFKSRVDAFDATHLPAPPPAKRK